jgi:hypothetical protein
MRISECWNTKKAGRFRPAPFKKNVKIRCFF